MTIGKAKKRPFSETFFFAQSNVSVSVYFI